jgi:hypothetical protein
MTLTILPVTLTDVAKCVSIRIASLGSLAIGRLPSYPGYIEARESSLRHDIHYNNHVHPLKVVDEEADEIIAYAKYEIYPEGRPDLEELRKPTEKAKRDMDKYGALREIAHRYFCDRDGGEIGQGPHIRECSCQRSKPFFPTHQISELTQNA